MVSSVEVVTREWMCKFVDVGFVVRNARPAKGRIGYPVELIQVTLYTIHIYR